MEKTVASGEKPGPRRRIIASPWTRIGLLIAGIEAILVLVGVIPRWAVVVIAVLALAAYFAWGRRAKSASVRQTWWSLALSQALVLFVPLVLWILGALVVVGIAAVAAVVLVVLILDR